MNMCDQIKNIEFVREVQKHEVLYNFNDPDYSRKDITTKAWEEVAAKVNLTVPDCKEKWRNLRTVFIRKMKPLPNGSGKKKAYYLEGAMQFCVPFVKSLVPVSSENSQQIPPHIPTEESTDISKRCYNDYLEDIVIDKSSQPSPPHTAQSASPSASPDRQFSSQQSTHTQSQYSYNPRAKRRLMVRNRSAGAVDRCVAEYFKAKKAKLESSTSQATCTHQNNERKDAIRMFLLSLLPELGELNDSQIKIFKRRVFRIIDEISTQPIC